MDRLYDFEIEFLISLIIAVLAIEGARATREFVVDIISIVLVTLIFIHISVLVLLYILNRVSENQSNPVDVIDGLSKYTIMITFATFLFFVSHLVFNFTFTSLTIEGDPVYLAQLEVSYKTSKRLIFYVGPSIVLIVLGLAGYFLILVPIAVSNDVNVSINPNSLRIQSDYQVSNRLTIHVRNESDKDLSLNINCEFPEEVYWRRANTQEEESGVLQDQDSVRGPGEKTINYDLRDEFSEARTFAVEVDVDYGYGSDDEEIQISSNPN